MVHAARLMTTSLRLQDLLLAVLAEEQPLRLAVNSACLPPLLAFTPPHSYPSQAPPPTLAAASAAAQAPPGEAPQTLQSLASGGPLPQGQVRDARSTVLHPLTAWQATGAAAFWALMSE